MPVVESFSGRLTTTQSLIFLEITQMIEMLVLGEFLELCVEAVSEFRGESGVWLEKVFRAPKSSFPRTCHLE